MAEQDALDAATGVLHRLRLQLDRPTMVGLAVSAVAVVFVCARLAFACDWDVTRFIVVGSDFVNGRGLPAGIHVIPGTGYDGQFYYRQALSPFDLSSVAHGIRLDGEFRLQRIAYPLVAYLLAFGQAALVPWTLVLANVAALGLLGFAGAVLARDLGRSPAFGLMLAGYFGLVTTLARDLTEVFEALLLVAAVLAFRRQRYLLAALAFAGGALARETEVFAVVGYGAVLIVRAVAARFGRGTAPPAKAHVTWIVPAVAFIAVQLWLYAATGHGAGAAGAQSNFGTPLVAAFDAVRLYAPHPFHLATAIWLAELLVLGLVVVLALASLGRTGSTPEERTTFLLLVGLTLCLSSSIWEGQVDFRSLAPMYEMAAVVLLGSRRRLALVAALVGVAFLVTFVHRVRFI